MPLVWLNSLVVIRAEQVIAVIFYGHVFIITYFVVSISFFLFSLLAYITKDVNLKN